MSEKICLELGVALWFIHVLIQGGLANAAFPSGYLFTPRDIQPMPKGLLFGRATRALANYVENFAPFVALDLGLMVSGHGGGYGAPLWILARAIYIPLYLFGVNYARTICWIVSLIALVMMLVQLVG